MTLLGTWPGLLFELEVEVGGRVASSRRLARTSRLRLHSGRWREPGARSNHSSAPTSCTSCPRSYPHDSTLLETTRTRYQAAHEGAVLERAPIGSRENFVVIVLCPRPFAPYVFTLGAKFLRILERVVDSLGDVGWVVRVERC